MVVAGTEVQLLDRIALRSILGMLHQSFEEVAWLIITPNDMGSQTGAIGPEGAVVYFDGYTKQDAKRWSKSAR